MHSYDGDSSNEHGQQKYRCWHHLKSNWGILIFGQAVCLLGSVTGATQSQLSLQCHWSAPGFSVFLFYSCLTFFLIPLYYQQKKQHVRLETHDSNDNDDDDANEDPTIEAAQDTISPENAPAVGVYLFLNTIWLQAPPWFYLIMGSLDVSASFCIVSAFSLTNITSVSLLTALSIPTTMVLSCFFLKRRYQLWHYVGVALCLFGIVCRVGQDWKQDHQQIEEEAATTYPHKFWGDVMACMGGVFFGINNVLGEVAVQRLGGPLEFLGMMGFFAAILAFIYSMVMERDEIRAFFVESRDICPAQTSTLLLLAYVATNVLGYYGGAHFLRISEATFFNLSFQTGSLWSVVFSIVGQHIYPDPLFYVSLVITVSGVVVYEMANKSRRESHSIAGPSSPEATSSIHLRELS
ncbi:solute carrier family 35, member F1/2 [Fistulifera solaris]|uniref:Solute carrier family 35, member F1/2 n=1 Tax=Fistulifera solaris TaxID=1519565 RepID=A0A1Z5KK67_FISSO|nr:solute carrier family 35, member F1/2 [Fistulifera solaris]|eukprot:GAX26679.1 solute carrier family 35, member F1/2 [Fistulifera solaris]